MKAIILAAGYGNRMRPLTDEIHKTLLTVNSKTIIDGIIDSLIIYDIREIVIVTGYLSDSLENYLIAKYPVTNFKFVNSPRYKETNNIFSLSLAINAMEIDDDIILIESDLVYEPSIIKKVIESKFDNVALVDKFRSGMDGTVVTVTENVVTNIIPPHLQNSNFDFSDKYKTLNIYKFSKDFCNTIFKQLLTYYATVIDDNCYYELILGILIYMQRQTIYAEFVDDKKWAEVDDPNDLNIAEFIFNKEERVKILENSFGGYWSHEITDFCFIRNMYFPNSSMISDIRNNLPNLIHNYGSRQLVLNQKLAYFLLYKKERTTLLNGAAQVYPILRTLFGDKMTLFPSPTFGEYPRIFKNCEVYLDRVGIDLKEIENKSVSCEVVIFTNPNNPTGSFIDSEWIFNFALKNSSKKVIVDESFIDFADGVSIIDLLEKESLDNIIVIKSLSKSLGIPGIRLGFVYSSNIEFNQALNNALPIWNSNSLAEYFLEIILKHRKSLELSYKNTIMDRELFTSKLLALDYIDTVYPSSANFILVKFKKSRSELSYLAKDLLAIYSVYVKDVSDKFNDERYYLRIAVRFPAENEMLISIMTIIIDSYPNTNWKQIWEKRDLNSIDTTSSQDIILGKLIKTDGFDRGSGNIEIDSWKRYVNQLSSIMKLNESDSLFEVGCGAGAFLYQFFLKGHQVGGIDFSDSLIKNAQSIMTGMNFNVGEAKNLDCIEKYDFVVANSVFFYFPNYEYAKEVLIRMIDKSKKKVLIMNIPDLKLKEECENIRKSALPPGEYEKKYEGLKHLYFDKEWFCKLAKTKNLKIEIFEQNITNYGNNKFRYNCILEK